MQPAETPETRPTIYVLASAAGVILMLVAIVVGALLNDLSRWAMVATAIPGIVLLLYGIRGTSGPQ